MVLVSKRRVVFVLFQHVYDKHGAFAIVLEGGQDSCFIFNGVLNPLSMPAGASAVGAPPLGRAKLRTVTKQVDLYCWNHQVDGTPSDDCKNCM